MSDFTLKWQEHFRQGRSAGIFRVFPDNPYDFFIGFSDHGEREFYFMWKGHEPESLNGLSLKNIQLKVSKHNDEFILSLTLLDNDYKDLFSVVCVDLARTIETVLSLGSAVSIIYSRLVRWSELLSKKGHQGMSLNEQRGLIGELTLLKLICCRGNVHVPSVIKGWRGPEGDTNDLSLNRGRIEVKAQMSSQAKGIKVSSLQQLDDDESDLFVALFRLSPAEVGVSIKSLISEIENILLMDVELLFEFRRKYLLSGYDDDAEYADSMYQIAEPTFYSVDDNFPRLIPSNVAEGISAVSYFVDADHIKSFEVSIEQVESVIHG